MRTALFYDTETTGLPLFKERSEDPRQPHIVQLGAALVDLDSRKTISSIDVIVRPDGWEIPAEVSAIHGITTEHALEHGIPEASAVALLMGLWNHRTRIGHNEQFDARILRIAHHRFPETFDEDIRDAWHAGTSECTQRLATPIMKLPPTDRMRAAGRFHHKSANLTEAYAHFTGNALENAHSAMADVLACMAVYFAIQDRAAVAA